MPVEVILPKVDMDMSTGQIASWAVEEGATVRKGDLLFEIETDKAAMEIDAPASGIVRNITGKTGVDIPVGQVVAFIYEEGEAEASSPTAEAATAEAEKQEAPSLAPPEDHETRSQEEEPVAISSRDAAPSGVRATPLARRLAREAGLDLSAIAGSGPKGRVVKADVAKAAETGAAPAAKAAEAPAPTAKPMSDDAVLKLFEEGSYELVPHDGMRKTIARRLVEAKTTIPHFYLTLDCEIDALLKLRKE
ncbi:E3 binding domain-containing protein, partial [Nitratireductor luteus]|uniref:E3 binding domain-containing protein n=1 Tax=Nitratireductor luteus TaxID=2976980 RepID=UPI00223F7762